MPSNRKYYDDTQSNAASALTARRSRKFKPGNIVRYTGGNSTAKAGAVAIVYGYKANSRHDSPPEWLNILWLSNDAGGQVNGSYYEDNFELMYEDPTRYRPDVTPEDRGLNIPDSYRGQAAMESLQQSVTLVRATGKKVECRVIEEEIVTTTTEKVHEL